MTPVLYRRLGQIQLWCSGYACGFGIAAMLSGYYMIAVMLVLVPMFAALGHQNIRMSSKADPR